MTDPEKSGGAASAPLEHRTRSQVGARPPVSGIVASTPLCSLEVVVLDTETTGLDATTARLVQVGALRIAGGDAAPKESFVRLVRPGRPIPAASTAIHGIRDADVATAPTAAEVLPELEAFVQGRVIVGHSIDYDLEVLRREAQRAGRRWPARRTLDVRLLARLAAPKLADYGLDGLCAWLGIAIEGRHTAPGDAAATARVFVALVPLLRRRGIRTLAEAELACRAMSQRESLEPGAISGAAPADDERPDTAALERIDSWPYRHRVRDVMSSPPAMLSGERTVADAVDLLIARGISSVFVIDADAAPGIVTERDALRVIEARGADALATPLREVRRAPLHAVSPDDFLYRAIGRMDRLGIRHLAVLDERQEIVGAVTTRNLLRHRASAAMLLGDELAVAGDESALGQTWARVPLMARLLGDEGVDPRRTVGVISAEICVLTKRAAELGEARMREAGRGGPPVPYALLVLGSAGRGESLLAADQDNAIVFRSGESGGPEDRWFEELGVHIADILDRVGVPYCKGGVMARNALWRRSVADWNATVDDWVGRQRPQDLLNVDIFFDARPVHGERTLGEEIWARACERGSASPTFRRALQETLAGWQPPVGFLGGFRTGVDDRVDLKAGGLMPIFTAARILSLKAGQKLHATPDRLRGAAAAGLVSESWAETIVAAHRTLLGLMLRQQIADLETGVPPGPRVNVRRLTRAERAALRDAVGCAGDAIAVVREGMM